MSKVNLYIDCTSGISGDMLCQCLTDLCEDKSFVEEQQQLVSEELHHEKEHGHNHGHNLADSHAEHTHAGNEEANRTHTHAQPYSHRSFQSILTLLSECCLDENVKAMTLKIYTILAIAEAEVHGETLETVHFHEVGRPQAIINMVGIAAAQAAISPNKVFCSKIIDGTGTVKCAHGEIEIPVPAVRALMKKSDLIFDITDVRMERVTPTGLAALLAMEPIYRLSQPETGTIIHTAEAREHRLISDTGGLHGFMVLSFL